MRNDSLISAKAELDRRAEELELSNRYKSEFLANMSHELRTPLNSIIMLSKMLAKNDKSGLGEKEVKKAQIINKSGEELLRLINDILDLSKIEAGKMSIHTSNFGTKDFTEDMQDFFEGIASDKKLKFIIDDRVQSAIFSDKERLYQIIRNFLSNAFKFTKEGSVTLAVTHEPEPGKIRISVKDTGIGIPEDKQEVIFEAFKQADGTTSREFGGTGLGLSIVRELTKLLQGHIELESDSGAGSTFSLIIPAKIDEEQIDEEGIPVSIKKANNTYASSKSIVQIKRAGQKTVNKEIKNDKKTLGSPQPDLNPNSELAAKNFNDDRRSIRKGDKVVLIVEDEQQFAESMSEVIQSEGYKTIIANTAKDGLELAKQFLPDGIILDLGLPDMDGEDALKLYKSVKEIRHIPIEIVSARDKDNSLLSKGAIGFLQKPIDENALKSVMSNIQKMQKKTIKDLLIVEDDEAQLLALNELLKGDDIKVVGVRSKADAISSLSTADFDAAIVDLGLKDGNGYEVCTFISDNYPNTRVIVYTGKNLKPSEEKKLKKATQSIILKTKDAEEKLRDEVALFLHRMETELDVQNLQRDPVVEKFADPNQTLVKDIAPPVIPVDEMEMPNPETIDRKTISIAELLLKELDDEEDKEMSNKMQNIDISEHKKTNSNDSNSENEQTNEPMEFRKKYSDQEAAPIIKNKNILVVDDDVRNIFVIASALENFEANIEEALNGKLALDMLKANDFDLIMMDTIMPEMDGLEAIKAIRSNDKWKNIPIIAITGKAQYEDKVACLNAGANAYIVKPVDYEQLLTCVCEMLLKNF
jgi:CheY-like chemotaxis protein/nitrogen-specific signal transduction histidine kinase